MQQQSATISTPTRYRPQLTDSARPATFDVATLDEHGASGTAQHGWFHYINTESLAMGVWHRTSGATTLIYGNQFDFNGLAIHGAEVALTALPGDSLNAVVASRPMGVAVTLPAGALPGALSTGMQREYGLAWQYRLSAASRWQMPRVG